GAPRSAAARAAADVRTALSTPVATPERRDFHTRRPRVSLGESMKRRTLARLSWLCLVLQLVGAGATFGQVLCVATDGHVALEIAHAGTCDTEARRHHGEEPAGIAACAEHGCTDIAFSQPALRSSHDEIAPT